MESIKEKLALYREYIRFLLFVIFAMSSGIVWNLFNVFIKKQPFYSIIFSFIGVFVLMFLLILMKRFHIYMEDLIKELK